MDLIHPCPCAVRYPVGEEMMDDDQFVCIPHRIGKSTLLCGKKSTYFPCQLFVGPEWYCSFVTYALIIVLTIFFLNNAAVPLGPAVVVLGTVSLFVTVMLFSATACSDPGIIFKYVTPSINNNTFADDNGDHDDDDDGNDDDIEIAITSGNMENIGGILEERQGHGQPLSEEQQSMVAMDMNSDNNHIKGENKTNNDSSSSSSHRPNKQPYVSVVPSSSSAYTPYPVPTGNRRGDRATRKSNGNKNNGNSRNTNARGDNTRGGSNRGGSNTGGGGGDIRGNHDSRGGGVSTQSGTGPNGEIWTMECSICQLYRPPTATHCYECGVCVDRLDHHCPWTGKCIAHKNLLTFKLFLGALLVHIALVVGATIYAVAMGLNVFRMRS